MVPSTPPQHTNARPKDSAQDIVCLSSIFIALVVKLHTERRRFSKSPPLRSIVLTTNVNVRHARALHATVLRPLYQDRQLYDWPDGTTLQGVKALRVKAERLALIRLCREGGRVTSKDVEGNARPCKAVQGLGRHF